MPEDERDINTTGVLDNLFETLRHYSQTRKVSDEELLRQRARQYAEADIDTDKITGDTLTVITFTLGSEHYGLSVDYVRSVRPLPPVTRVPNAPPFFIGVVNVRGAVVTLFDLGVFFGLGRTTDAAELIVIEFREMTFGLPVKRVLDVMAIPQRRIAPLDDMRYAAGTIDRIMILEADEIFNDDRILRG